MKLRYRFYTYFKSLSFIDELVIVLTLGIGYLAITNGIDSLSQKEYFITNRHLTFLLLYEIVVMMGISLFLSYRNTNFDQFGFTYNRFDFLFGILLYLIALIAAYIPYQLFSLGLFQSAGQDLDVKGIANGLNITQVIAISIVNPIFEESIICAYLITRLRSKVRPYLLVLTSVFLRALYHSNQGVYVWIQIVPFGLVFAIWFLRTKRVWPIIIAHFFWDIIALLPYSLTEK